MHLLDLEPNASCIHLLHDEARIFDVRLITLHVFYADHSTLYLVILAYLHLRKLLSNWGTRKCLPI